LAIKSGASLHSYKKYWTFGLEAPIIDFFEDGYITAFADLNDLLRNGADGTMQEAKDRSCKERNFCPSDTGPKMRWIHIPTNNMEWVEVCRTRSKIRHVNLSWFLLTILR